METTDLGSVLGIASGVSASVLMVCIAIGLTARFRHQNHHSAHCRRRPNPVDKGKADLTVDHPGHDTDDPDIIINSNSGTYIVRRREEDARALRHSWHNLARPSQEKCQQVRSK